MKQTPLKRGKEALKRGAALARGTKRLPRQSKRGKPEREQVKAWRAEYLSQYPFCEVGQVLTRAGVENFDCTNRAECLHERRKRTAQGSLTDPHNLMRSCYLCNAWIEANPAQAKALALCLSAMDDPAKSTPGA